jgi:hypothetical protein
MSQYHPRHSQAEPKAAVRATHTGEEIPICHIVGEKKGDDPVFNGATPPTKTASPNGLTFALFIE